MAAFEPRLDILPPAQRRLWDELGTTPPGFVLYGGTAIALRLAHRQSEDFDFFSNDAFAPSELRRRISYLKDAENEHLSGNTLWCRVKRGDIVRVSFFGDLEMKRVGEPDLAANGVWIASLIDLAATKAKVMQDRASLKDYLDMDALLRSGLDLPMVVAAAQAIYGERFTPWVSKQALTCFIEGDVTELAPDAQRRLSAAAQALNLDALPQTRAKSGLLPREGST
ncbi:MAG TPA: nucleotidyl transferase AbiEii/AbiGii toxin family protein [Candidatus Acidoferrales bacterium]|jgi:hypothetical protein|nr:nucleotidyl transferase AbiEii/AbiGii toxin family protein [Candidatus Acidoferrales bacterium]